MGEEEGEGDREGQKRERKKVREDFPDNPVARTPCSQCRRPWFDPWSRN